MEKEVYNALLGKGKKGIGKMIEDDFADYIKVGVKLVDIDSDKLCTVTQFDGKKMTVKYLNGETIVVDNSSFFRLYEDTDNVEHPSHYCQHPSGIECIEITEHYDFCIGNAIKYLWRAGLKSDSGMTDREKKIEDLRKAIWYINREIQNL